MLRLPISVMSIISSQDYFEKTHRSMLCTLDSIEPIYGSYIICPQKPVDIDPRVTPIIEEIKCDYSYWLLKNLIKYCKSDFVLIQQWDSCVIDPNMWSDEFLSYDYIGALWAIEGNKLVGNGGFSLRSAAFINRCESIADSLPIGQFIAGNEDYFACHTCFNYMKSKGIKFPPFELARRFSVERPTNIVGHQHRYDDLASYLSFGFHGDFNTAGMDFIYGKHQNSIDKK